MHLFAKLRTAAASSPERSLQLINLSALLETVGWSSLAPSLPALYKSLGLTRGHVSAISSAVSFTALVSVLVQGRLSDRFGRVGILRFSAVVQLVGSIFLGLFAGGTLDSVALFVAVRVLSSGLKCGMVVSQAYVADVSAAADESDKHDTEKESAVGSIRDKGDKGGRTTGNISKLMSWSNFGFIFGPIIGGQLAHWGGLSSLGLSFGSGRKPNSASSSVGLGGQHTWAAAPYIFSVAAFAADLLVLHSLPKPPSSSSISSSSSSSSSSPSPSPTAKTVRTISREREFSGSGGRREGKEQREVSDAKIALTHSGNSSSSGSSGDSSVLQSLPFLLHLKFAFQTGNTIYESLFAQHLEVQLGVTQQQLGWLLGMVGVLAASVNGVVVPALVRTDKGRKDKGRGRWFLMAGCCLGQTLGLCLWALTPTLALAVTGTVLIALCSNVFLAMLSGQLGQLSTSTSAATASDSASSTGSAGTTTGLQRRERGGEEVEVEVEVSQELNDMEGMKTNRERTSSPTLTKRESHSKADVSLSGSASTRIGEFEKEKERVAAVGSSSSSSSTAGTTFGLSTVMDRLARGVAPLVGGAALEYYGVHGLAAACGVSGMYTAAVLLWNVNVNVGRGVTHRISGE